MPTPIKCLKVPPTCPKSDCPVATRLAIYVSINSTIDKLVWDGRWLKFLVFFSFQEHFSCCSSFLLDGCVRVAGTRNKCLLCTPLSARGTPGPFKSTTINPEGEPRVYICEHDRELGAGFAPPLGMGVVLSAGVTHGGIHRLPFPTCN